MNARGTSVPFCTSLGPCKGEAPHLVQSETLEPGYSCHTPAPPPLSYKEPDKQTRLCKDMKKSMCVYEQVKDAEHRNIRCITTCDQGTVSDVPKANYF